MSINNNDVLIIENLSNYKYNFSTRNIIVNKCDDISNYKPEKSYYFILDSGSNDIYHLIYESFIFINLLIDLNIKHGNNIKILTKFNNNEILKSLLSNFFPDIKNEIVNNIDNYNNICYSPLIYSIYYHHRLIKDDYYYNHHLNFYLNTINKNLDLTVHKYKNVYINNDNDNNNDNNYKVHQFIHQIGGIIIQDTIENIKNNLNIINNADNIFLSYNSSFYLYCMVLKNKNIYIIENFIYRPNGINIQVMGMPLFGYLYNIINKNNKIACIN
jgi:hypothetical protein